MLTAPSMNVRFRSSRPSRLRGSTPTVTNRAKQWTRLLWKEAVEVRWFLYGGALMMGVVPLISVIQGIYWMERRGTGQFHLGSNLANAVIAIGPALVIFTAIGQVCRDLGSERETFWRSSPLGAVRVAIAKFVVGLGLCLLLAAAVLGLQLLLLWLTDFWTPQSGHDIRFNRVYGYRDTFHAMLVHLPLLAMLYAIVFALAAWTARAVPAGFFAAIAAALVYFAPLLWPALEPVNLWSVMDDPALWLFGPGEPPRFFGGADRLDTMLFGWTVVYSERLPGWWLYTGLGTVLAGVVGVIILARGWRARVGVMGLAWAFVIVALGLFASVAAQVGSNLEADLVVPLSVDRWAVAQDVALTPNGRGVVAVTRRRPDWVSGDLKPVTIMPADANRPVLLDADAGLPLGIDATAWYPDEAIDIAISPFDPNEAWVLAMPRVVQKRGNVTHHVFTHLMLHHVRFGDEPLHETLQIEPAHSGVAVSIDRASLVWLDGRLFMLWDVVGTQVAEVDTASAKPTLLRRWSPEQSWTNGFDWAGSDIGYNLEELDGLSPQQVLALRQVDAEHWMRQITSEDGRLLALVDGDRGLLTYELASLTDKRATYAPAGQRPFTTLEQVLGVNVYAHAAHGDWVAILISASQPGVMLFDVSDPAKPRKAGHYYAPGDDLRWIGFLADGRLAVAGRSLHVLRMPD